MATRTELKTLFKAAMSPVDRATNFSAVDTTDAAINALLETYGLDQASARELRAHKPEIFALMEETLEELLPKAIDDAVGGFVETRTYGRDAEPVFDIKGVGKQRARLGIVEGARGGIYKAKRLDNKTFQVPVKVWTVKLFVTLEDILLGNYTLADLLANARDGFVEKVYISAVQALRTAKTLAPGANIDAGNGFVAATVDRLIGIANQYGNAMIMGFRPAISKINNGAGWSTTPNVSAYDVDDIRNRGFVTIYKGIPVVELPNYLADTNNNQWVFKAGDMFILPAAAKPVKVAMKGDLTIIEDPHPSGSVEQNIHRIMGVGLALAGNVCVYTDTEITDENALY
jgi:hypothetical protein